ncbi:DUF6980 family protein [Actinoplanes sandaracinus]|uniref:DUF6980 family protein n=1 Tax=Actinoplanes sandaracinus TaxID=3045177 RepID=UPI0038993405
MPCRRKSQWSCDLHPRDECPDVAVLKCGSHDKFWYGLPIRDGGSSAYRVNRCPWCGAVL